MLSNNSANFSFDSPARRESRKRRRVSERRRVFGKLAGQTANDTGNNSPRSSGSRDFTSDGSSCSWSAPGESSIWSSRSDSPLNYGGSDKISMKIQFHITVAPDSEPLITDLPSASATLTPSPSIGVTNSSALNSPGSAASSQSDPFQPLKSTESVSIGDQIHEKLCRQNTLSTRRRGQLFALHNQPAMETSTMAGGAGAADNGTEQTPTPLATPNGNGLLRSSLPDHRLLPDQTSRSASTLGPVGRDQGARSSTITGGMSDEATVKFLERHHSQRRQSMWTSSTNKPSQQQALVDNQSQRQQHNNQHQHHHHQRGQIFYKRDGQRFGHEFTLKLAVDKTYRCLLKVRPLIPLQAISIQGHHVLFVDCSQQAAPTSGAARRATAASVSAPVSSLALAVGSARSGWQPEPTSGKLSSPHSHNHNHHRPLNHAQTLGAGAKLSLSLSRQELLYQQQQNQMLRYFATSHCSTSHSHLGGQLIYMFDWFAGRFEVNKNKARTQVNAVLKFKNGQILSLPFQIKFYEPEQRQHLNWGNQLHFIDFDCSINSLGQINVDRVQYH